MKKYVLALLVGCSPLLADIDIGMRKTEKFSDTLLLEDSIESHKSKKDKKKDKEKKKSKAPQPTQVADSEASIAEVTDETFDSALRENSKAAIAFSAPWCGPCKRLAPILYQLSQQYRDQYAFFKVNGDKYRSLMDKYNVKGFPTVIFFENGEEVDRTVGFISKDELSNMISKKINH